MFKTTAVDQTIKVILLFESLEFLSFGFVSNFGFVFYIPTSDASLSKPVHKNTRRSVAVRL